MTNNDMELVREYATHQSEQAFETLVSRHVNWVYATALRLVHDPHLAEEIAQAVFIILARKSDSLTAKTILSGWLYRTACYAAKDARRAQRRRQHYEQEASMQSTLHEAQADLAWQELSPLLDEAMMQLAQSDRDALVLRFYENKSLQEIGAAVGVSEEAAKKRVSRAVEKLRECFFKRGVTSTAATIAGAISAKTHQAAPAGLAKTISAVALAKGAAASTSTLTLVKGAMKLMAWTKAKTAIVVGAIALLTASMAAVSIAKILTPSEPFVKITGKGLVETSYSNAARVTETIDMTIWTDGKSYRISIISKGHLYSLSSKRFGSWDVDTLHAQYTSDGTDIFALSDEPTLPLHPTREGFGGSAFAGRFPSWEHRPSVPMVVKAAWLAYCSSDYFNVASNHTGLDLGESWVWPDCVTNLVAYWKDSTLPQNIIGWSRNWYIPPQTDSDQPKVAIELKQYPDGFKAFKFAAEDPVIVGNKQWPRHITLEKFWPKYLATNGDDVMPLSKATFVADSITVVKGAFDPLPPVTVPDLKVMDYRFQDIVPFDIIVSHATPQGWPTRGSKAFEQVKVDVERLLRKHRAEIQSDLKLKEQSQVVIPP